MRARHKPAFVRLLFPFFLHSFFLLLLLPLASGTNATTNPEARVLLSWLQTIESPPTELVSSWSAQRPDPCLWSYVSCSPQSHITEIVIPPLQLLGSFPTQFTKLPFLTKLVLSGNNLTGEIPHEIGNLTSLAVLDLSSNALTGNIPPEIGKLRYLDVLSLSSNLLSGEMPPEIWNCSLLRIVNLVDNHLSGRIPVGLGRLGGLEVLRLGGNPAIEGDIPEDLSNCENLILLGLAFTNVSGTIPAGFGRLGKLQTLSMYSTMVSGEIPVELGNCSELVNLYLHENRISGRIPAELGRLQKLEKLLLWQNELIGTVPETIGNLTLLSILDLSLNRLSGDIPAVVSKLGKLTTLLLSDNGFTGRIPSALGNCTALTQLELDNNRLHGEIPLEIGRLTELTLFFAWQNDISGTLPAELANCVKLQALDLSHNRLVGWIPPGLLQLKNMSKLLLISNDLSGPIPPEIGNCTALVRLRLGDNQLSGAIPGSIGKLASLNFLELSDNRLSGMIPPEIGSCTKLEMVDFRGNRIEGSIPSSLGSIHGLHVLDLSINNLSGSIPDSFGSLKFLNKFMLNRNHLSGLIPNSLGFCSGLQLLDLSFNRISGSIPDELGNLQNLDISLNLSWNSLSGLIPKTFSQLSNLACLDLSHNMLTGSVGVLGDLQNLVSLNISYNNLSGLLPDTKLFRDLPQSVLEGNSGLCTTGDGCFIQVNQTKDGKTHKKNLKWVIALLVSATLLVLISSPLLIKRVHAISTSPGGMGGDWKFTMFQKVNFSFDELLMGLVEENVIGKGCSGVVYRVDTGRGMVVAVKKLWPSKNEENSLERDSFISEIKILGLIRHRNIIRLLGFCTNTNVWLLMYDYMQNGSLGELLHEKKMFLDWHTRHKIILGAAQGLAYLHHDCNPPIVHRDIKANNILIGNDFEAYLADFGLARPVDPSEDTRSANTVAGSYGYMPPEYGYRVKITEKSDVYSYGVVLLEVLTGMQPTDPKLPEGMHIVNWVCQKIQNGSTNAIDILDQRLRDLPDAQIDEMSQALGVALLCVNSCPEDRPAMKDVTVMLKEIMLESEECCAKTRMIIEHMSRAPPSHCPSLSRSCEPLITSPVYCSSSGRLEFD
ncbi:unnamed protein product [Victoria cruziana]